MCIGCPHVQRGVEPFVAKAQREIGREVDGVGDVPVGHSRAVEVDVADMMVVVSSKAAADIPPVERVKSHIEGDAAVCRPVSVDVLRSGDASACCFVVGDDGADAIVCA